RNGLLTGLKGGQRSLITLWLSSNPNLPRCTPSMGSMQRWISQHVGHIIRTRSSRAHSIVMSLTDSLFSQSECTLPHQMILSGRCTRNWFCRLLGMVCGRNPGLFLSNQIFKVFWLELGTHCSLFASYCLLVQNYTGVKSDLITLKKPV
ncbi:hypothetical protein BDP27DRAFT_1018794, partial [Rhodocollybia butyracea]